MENLNPEGCAMCGEKGGFFNKIEACLSKTHRYHENCLKKTSKDLNLYFFISVCNHCIEQFTFRYKNKTNCHKCKKLLNRRPNSTCNFEQAICEECLLDPLFNNHFLACLNCRSISCSSCQGTIKIFFLSSSAKCITHNDCISCMKNRTISDCLACRAYLEKGIYECSLCGEPCNLSDVCCKSGHFFCKFCLQHFMWPQQDCTSCKELFKIPNKEQIQVDYYKIPYNSFRTIEKRALPTNTCFDCNRKGHYPIYQLPNCVNCYFCLECVNGSSLKHSNCSVCTSYFSRHQQKVDGNAIVCRLCLNVPEGNSKFCSDFHFICIKCRNFLVCVEKVSLLKIISCKKCIIELRALREYADFFEPPKQKVLFLLPKYRFPCKHEIRHDALLKILQTAIENFLISIRKSDLLELNKGFNLSCQYCSNFIFAPLKKFKPGLESAFTRDDWELVNTFSSIFDGLPYKFYKTNKKLECVIGGCKTQFELS